MRPLNAFDTHRPIRFGDCDPAGIAYYPRLIDMSHAVIEDWFALALQIDYPQFLGVRGMGFPTVAMNVQFRAPFKFGSTVLWRLSIAKLSARSVQLRHVAHASAKADAQCLMEMDQTCVCLDRAAHQAMTWPDDVRAAMQAFSGVGT